MFRDVHWHDIDWWIGYLEDYPNYWMQRETLEDLIDHLQDLYRDLTGGLIP